MYMLCGVAQGYRSRLVRRRLKKRKVHLTLLLTMDHSHKAMLQNKWTRIAPPGNED